MFEFATATKIIFGKGVMARAGELAARHGKKAFVFTGKSPERAGKLFPFLCDAGVEYCTLAIDREPAIDTIQQATERAREYGASVIIALGGGSVIDTGKAVAAMIPSSGSLQDHLEVIGRGEPLREPSLPFIAIPTTAGTGSEVTSNAVMESPAHKVKISLRHPFMFPLVALVDPSLTHDLPPHLTASSGLDALTQVLEPYVSNRANPLTDALCEEGLRRAGSFLLKAYEHGDDEEARENMAIVSLFGGLALANAKLGAVHGFAGPLGGMYGGGHGALCAALLPSVMAANITALKERHPESPLAARYDRIACLLTGRLDACSDDGITFVADLVRKMKVPGLSYYGVREEDFPAIISRAAAASSMQGNPVRLSEKEMESILRAAL